MKINSYKATTYHGKEIGDGQVIHGQHSNGDEDNLKTLGLSCVRWFGSDCLEVLPKSTETEKAAFAKRQREITTDLSNASSEILGSSLNPDNFDETYFLFYLFPFISLYSISSYSISFQEQIY